MLLLFVCCTREANVEGRDIFVMKGKQNIHWNINHEVLTPFVPILLTTPPFGNAEIRQQVSMTF
jgi:hypothetical protein